MFTYLYVRIPSWFVLRHHPPRCPESHVTTLPLLLRHFSHLRSGARFVQAGAEAFLSALVKKRSEFLKKNHHGNAEVSAKRLTVATDIGVGF